MTHSLAASRSIYATSIGIILIVLGGIFLGRALKFFDITNAGSRNIAAAVFGLLGTALIVHGEFLVFFGNWSALLLAQIAVKP